MTESPGPPSRAEDYVQHSYHAEALNRLLLAKYRPGGRLVSSSARSGPQSPN